MARSSSNRKPGSNFGDPGACKASISPNGVITLHFLAEIVPPELNSSTETSSGDKSEPFMIQWDVDGTIQIFAPVSTIHPSGSDSHASHALLHCVAHTFSLLCFTVRNALCKSDGSDSESPTTHLTGLGASQYLPGTFLFGH